jgi:hypothetical protein
MKERRRIVLTDCWLFGGGGVDDGWRIRIQSYFLHSVAISRHGTDACLHHKKGNDWWDENKLKSKNLILNQGREAL